VYGCSVLEHIPRHLGIPLVFPDCRTVTHRFLAWAEEAKLPGRVTRFGTRSPRASSWPAWISSRCGTWAAGGRRVGSLWSSGTRMWQPDQAGGGGSVGPRGATGTDG